MYLYLNINNNKNPRNQLDSSYRSHIFPPESAFLHPKKGTFQTSAQAIK